MAVVFFKFEFVVKLLDYFLNFPPKLLQKKKLNLSKTNGVFFV